MSEQFDKPAQLPTIGEVVHVRAWWLDDELCECVVREISESKEFIVVRRVKGSMDRIVRLSDLVR
jgi:hypothetical protein